MTSSLGHDLEHVENILASAIATAFENCGEADDTNSDHQPAAPRVWAPSLCGRTVGFLARVAAQAVSRQLLESGLQVRHTLTASTHLTPQEHRHAAERLLSEASHQTGPGGRPVARDGRNVDLEVLRLLLARAQVHATLAAPSSEDER